jgi:DNA-binding NarL/FixJ family response regulator
VTATARISARHPEVRVIVLTTFDLDEYAFGALDAGASGFLLKDVEGVELIRAVRAVAAGDAVLSPRITREVLARRASEPRSSLSPIRRRISLRARSTCSARSRGLTNGEIAAELHLGEATVKTHVGRILGKLGARDRVQAVIIAHRHGYVHRPTAARRTRLASRRDHVGSKRCCTSPIRPPTRRPPPRVLDGCARVLADAGSTS